jgi:hypothetical protein
MKTKEVIYNDNLKNSGLLKENMNSYNLYPVVMKSMDQFFKQAKSEFYTKEEVAQLINKYGEFVWKNEAIFNQELENRWIKENLNK